MKITIENKEARFIVRLADTSVILGQRLAEMCSNGPTLEEDIALSNISLDLFGRADELYKIVAKLEGDKFTPDDYVFRRNEREYYNIKLVEQPNEDFAWVIARQFLHDVYAREVFTQLSSSKNADLAGISQKVLKEIKYSYVHSKDWMNRLGLGTEESNTRLQKALDHLMKYVDELFAFDELDKTYLADCEKLNTVWHKEVDEVLLESNLKRNPFPPLSMRDYRDGFHSEHMGHLLSIMQYLPRAYPDAKW
ncbi:MAG: phenylacetate-CoA oxygenase subunit PaaC [Crocinitomicaceae bacterium]|nr:phenylacetate-CoA oxygenase subunit PaaC [Crocinitomicaceae bacterium]